MIGVGSLPRSAITMLKSRSIYTEIWGKFVMIVNSGALDLSAIELQPYLIFNGYIAQKSGGRWEKVLCVSLRLASGCRNTAKQVSFHFVRYTVFGR